MFSDLSLDDFFSIANEFGVIFASDDLEILKLLGSLSENNCTDFNPFSFSACSSVWRARRRPGPGPAGARAGATHYALKVFPLRDPARRSMLVRELSLLCACRCDCLVGLEGAFADDGDAGGQGVTLVLEYMDRGSLADLLHGGGGGRPRRARLPDAALAAVSFQVFWGLSYLHFEGVLHRDVKVSRSATPRRLARVRRASDPRPRRPQPANVLVSAAGRVKLADFGIVSRRPPGDAPGASPLGRTVVGTTRYMAPERLRGRPHGRPSDVWGAGLVLLEAARGDAGPGEGVTSVVSRGASLRGAIRKIQRDAPLAALPPAATTGGARPDAGGDRHGRVRASVGRPGAAGRPPGLPRHRAA